MEQRLISKKELLLRYRISYGALYRWKRKGLIPEDWFIKKATVTGQETFFPIDLICERIELIQKQKDDLSLDELSIQLSSTSKKRATVTVETVLGKKVFSLDEITSIVVDDGNGRVRDITKELMGGNK